MAQKLLIRLFYCLAWTPFISYSQESVPDHVRYEGRLYPLYPERITELPDMPSPLLTNDGREVIIGHTTDDQYVLFDVTVENGDDLRYDRGMYGKGRQLDVNSLDFPDLANTGLHNEVALKQTNKITGLPVPEITQTGWPEQYSQAGFMAEDEDIISVLINDNQLVKEIGLKHPDLASPLFHIWNIALAGIQQGIFFFEAMQIDYIYYNGHKVYIKWQGSRGWQESIFNDEIMGQFQIEVWRDMETVETNFLQTCYPELNDEEMADMIRKLSYIHTGEMVPYYIVRYGFYEGHTDFRADPIAIASIFRLRDLEAIETCLNGNLYLRLKEHYNSK
ncbi:MAG: hypothetical protein JXB19_09795 [Bacteroidales bacterium]|nr:hypothetical protein [Bacteroidales bacterium]